MVFFDEAVFSNPVYDMKVWFKTGTQAPTVSMDKVRFKAVSCGAAINLQGEVVARKTYDGAYTIPRFIEYLGLLKRRLKQQPVHVVLDNLLLHRSSVVRDYCLLNGINLVFTPSYSSEYMCVERLWRVAKVSWRRDLLL